MGTAPWIAIGFVGAVLGLLAFRRALRYSEPGVAREIRQYQRTLAEISQRLDGKSSTEARKRIAEMENHVAELQAEITALHEASRKPLPSRTPDTLADPKTPPEQQGDVSNG